MSRNRRTGVSWLSSSTGSRNASGVGSSFVFAVVVIEGSASATVADRCGDGSRCGEPGLSTESRHGLGACNRRDRLGTAIAYGPSLRIKK